jgi:hypothetical protein
MCSASKKTQREKAQTSLVCFFLAAGQNGPSARAGTTLFLTRQLIVFSKMFIFFYLCENGFFFFSSESNNNKTNNNNNPKVFLFSLPTSL